MAKQNKPTLKTYFLTGATPTEQQYKDLIDSFVHLDDQAAVDAQIVTQLLQTYDQNLKSANTNGPIDTLGDVFSFLAGIQDNTKLSDQLAKINWSNLPGKPTSVNVQLATQYLATGITKLRPLSSSFPMNPVVKGLLAVNDIDGNTVNSVIKEIEVERRFISIPTGGAPVEFYTDVINALLISVTPKVNL